jgi:hypothetical protein
MSWLFFAIFWSPPTELGVELLDVEVLGVELLVELLGVEPLDVEPLGVELLDVELLGVCEEVWNPTGTCVGVADEWDVELPGVEDVELPDWEEEPDVGDDGIPGGVEVDVDVPDTVEEVWPTVVEDALSTGVVVELLMILVILKVVEYT